ncbi:NAD(P)H-dependent amine dehydrogenase family protein [Nocardia aurantia]|uniref:2,4-diaminopentanoate dehydrogenase n=1 Tax=Nocardia aurantia TaxID=2585199 RepID=A0A7K0DFL6_9NOCA|nr:diacylglycerol kinase [Nocardia aurantia]MQY24478.1 2,4-diaminopentanoate dehydrogenase [Nocardia aurantia]
MSAPAYRVVQWSTGNVGRRSLRSIIARPELELVGVWVSSDAKAGRDAGELAGLDREIGVAATTDAQALLDLKPDCIVHTAMADDRLAEAVEDLKTFLRAGINVVSSSPVFLQFPYGTVPPELIDPVIEAAEAGGASLWVNGIDPGWANDWLPLLLSSGSERIDTIVCSEILDYSTYDNPKVLFDIMGFGREMGEGAKLPLLLQPGVLTLAWGSVIRQLAAALDVELDEVTQDFQRLPAPEPIRIGTHTVESGTAAALRFRVSGVRGGREVLVLEHVTRLHPELAPDWPQPAGQGGYRVEILGDPDYVLDLQLSSNGDHALGGVVGTAARLVSAVPAVIRARPGLLTAVDLPLTTGRGLVR